MNALHKTLPPYTGSEPYLHLCFSEASAKKVSALLRRGASADEAERALLRANGFSQDLIGTPEKPARSRLKLVIGVTLAVTSLLLAAGAFLYFLRKPKDGPAYRTYRRP